MSGPTFVVAGGARCGTSALAEGLREQPTIFVTEPKEPHYFALHARGAHFTAPGDDHTINRVSVTDRDAYLALYPSAAEAARYDALGDASVSTLYYHQDAVPEIVRTNPAMKVVVLLREPVSRTFSAHQYMRARGLEPVEDVLEAVALEEERIAAGWHHIWHYTRMSRYADGIAALQQALPPEQLGVWFHDDLDTDFHRVLGEVVTFLGAPAPAAPESEEGPERVNISGTPRSAVVQRALAAATGNERVRRTVKGMTSYRFRERVRRIALARGDVSPAVRDALAPRFEDDLTRLRTLLPGAGPAWLGEAPTR